MPMSPRLLRPRAAGGFNPKTISGLLVWLDANDSSSYTIATGVSQWRDKSGAGRNFSQATGNNQPIVSTVTQNGKAVLEFNGTSHQLQNGTNFLQIASCTLFGVYRRLGGAFGGVISSSGNADRSPGILIDNSQGVIRGYLNVSLAGTNVANSFHVTCGTVDNGASTIFINGTQTDTDAASNTLETSQSTTSIGTYRQAAANFMNGYIGEILAYDRVLAASERQAVERYLGAKWGIAVAQPPAASSITAQYLIAAGGGGGGGYTGSPFFGGGGGGGGVLSGSQTLSSGQTYTVTIGGGGAGAGTSAARGTTGANSVFSALTANGGGGGGFGGSTLANGLSGGCGGGGGANYSGTTGFIGAGGSATTGQGFDGGRGYHDNTYETVAAGGGGGAGVVGGDGTRFGSGRGGDGALSSITGTSIAYAGGGAAMGDNANGGAGIGGGGARDTAGGTNTGGGGGAASGGAGVGLGAAGGSGVVIIRLPAAASSTTGSPTVTTSGGDTIYRFTGSGSITI